MVDNIEIRRYFNVYNKIDLTRYQFLNKILPTNFYYKWKKKDTQFNPFVKHIKSGEQYQHTYTNSLVVGDTVLNVENISVEPYKEYNIVLEVPNHIEGEYRQNNGGGCDMMEIDISEFNESVVYEIGIWKVKKKTGENMKENKNMYHMGSLSTKEYFTDFVEYSYELNTLRYPDYCYFR